MISHNSYVGQDKISCSDTFYSIFGLVPLEYISLERVYSYTREEDIDKIKFLNCHRFTIDYILGLSEKIL